MQSKLCGARSFGIFELVFVLRMEMGFTDGVTRLLSGLLLIALLAHGFPLSPDRTRGLKPHKGPAGDRLLPRTSEPYSVLVWCDESSMEIRVLADLYLTGVIVDAADVRLGRHPLAKGGRCGATDPGDGQYVITADLTDCGTKLVFTDEWLVYENSVFYSPAPSPEGIIRMMETEIPFQCYYGRQYSVDSNSLLPTWVPFVTTQSAEDSFYFSLRLLTEDWHYERPSNVYYLSDVIHLEASVFQGNHVPLRIFAETCVATLTPDVNSDPRYAFIEDGCFTDASVTGSSSHFLSRDHDNELHIQLETFRFFQQSRTSIYITCLLKAEPVALGVESTNQACSYLDGRWKAVDGDDRTCGRCDGPGPLSTGQKTPEIGVWKRGAKAEASTSGKAVTKRPAGVSESAMNVTIGPLIFLKRPEVGTPRSHAAERSGTSVDTPAVAAKAGSAVDPSAVVTDSGTAVDTPMALPVELGTASSEVLMTGWVEASNENPTLPLTGRSASAGYAPPGLYLEAGTDVDALAKSEAFSTPVLTMKQLEDLDDLTTVDPVEVEIVDEDEQEGSVGGDWV